MTVRPAIVVRVAGILMETLDLDELPFEVAETVIAAVRDDVRTILAVNRLHASLVITNAQRTPVSSTEIELPAGTVVIPIARAKDLLA